MWVFSLNRVWSGGRGKSASNFLSGSKLTARGSEPWSLVLQLPIMTNWQCGEKISMILNAIIKHFISDSREWVRADLYLLLFSLQQFPFIQQVWYSNFPSFVSFLKDFSEDQKNFKKSRIPELVFIVCKLHYIICWLTDSPLHHNSITDDIQFSFTFIIIRREAVRKPV